MKHKILILYKSVTGFTKKYADFIAKETGGTAVDFKKADPKTLHGYDCIIFGSRAHAGRIDGLGKLRKLLAGNFSGRLILFVTGATPNSEEDSILEFWKQNLTADEQKHLPHFYFQDGLCYEKMPLADRLMMKAASLMLQKKKKKNASDLAFEQAIQSSYDISSDIYAKPLISYLVRSGFCDAK